MFKKFMLATGVLFSSSQGSIAADFYSPDGNQGPNYPLCCVYGGRGAVIPTQLNYADDYLPVRGYRNSGPGTQTFVTDGYVRASDLVASAPAVVSLDQRITAAVQQLQLVSTQYQQMIAQAQQTATQAQRGVTAVSAMANIWMPSAAGRTAWAVNASTFQGEVGGGFSVAHRLNVSVPLAITAAYGNGAGSAHIGRVGLMGEF
jgi:hypothetical protein